MHPIVWTEGAFLSQQHFQYWEAWLLEQGQLWFKTLFPHAYGLVHCIFDEESFKQQACVVDQLIWWTEQGTWLRFDARTMPRLGTTLEDKEDQWVYLSVPKNKLCSGLSGYSSAGEQAVYQAEYCEIKDQYDQERLHELCLGIPRYQLSTTPKDPHLYDCWPLVKLKRMISSHYFIDKEYIPLSMTVSASFAMQARLAEIQSKIQVKLKDLAQHLKVFNDPEVAQEYSLLALFGFELNSMVKQGSAHPIQLYESLVKLIMQLRLRQRDFIHFEPYNHSAINELMNLVFDELCNTLEVEQDRLPRYNFIKNTRANPTVETLEIEHLQGHLWYLSVDFSNMPADSVSKFLSQAKLGTIATLDYMIASALPGILLTHLSRPPKGIRIEEGHEYFSLDTEGLDWKIVKEERSLMLYHPPFLEGRNISLILVKD